MSFFDFPSSSENVTPIDKSSNFSDKAPLEKTNATQTGHLPNGDLAHANHSSSRPGSVKEVPSVAFARAQVQAKPSLWTKNMFQLYLVLLRTVMLYWFSEGLRANAGSVASFDSYKEYFGIDPDNGIPKNTYPAWSGRIGGCVGVMIGAMLIDWKGRRVGWWVGTLVRSIALIFLAASPNLTWWAVANEFQAIGSSASFVAASIYSLELVHPSYRGIQFVISALGWPLGQIPGAFLGWATADMAGQWSFRILMIAAIPASALLAFTIPTVPESPRWLVANARYDEAHAILTKYHGDGDPNSAIVLLEMKQMQEASAISGSDKRWWDFRDVFNSRESVLRFLHAFMWVIMGMWAGNGVVTGYYSEMLETVGISGLKPSLLITGARTPVEILVVVIAAYYIDRIGRRRLIIAGSVLLAIVFSIATPLAAITPLGQDSVALSASLASAKAFIAMVFVFNLVWNFSINTVKILYVLEVLPFDVRAKAFATVFTLGNISSFYNGDANALAIKSIGWRYYMVFIFWNLVAAGIAYLFFVETTGRTLEEITAIFQAIHPVKTSLSKSRIIVDGDDIVWFEDSIIYG